MSSVKQDEFTRFLNMYGAVDHVQYRIEPDLTQKTCTSDVLGTYDSRDITGYISDLYIELMDSFFACNAKKNLKPFDSKLTRLTRELESIIAFFNIDDYEKLRINKLTHALYVAKAYAALGLCEGFSRLVKPIK